MLQRTLAIIISISLAIFSTLAFAEDIPAIGNTKVFLAKYVKFRTEKLQQTNPSVVVIRLGFVKGMSLSFTAMTGSFALNLQTGTYNATFDSLSPGQTYSLWLVDQQDSAPVSDFTTANLQKLTQFTATSANTGLSGALSMQALAGFSIDRVVLALGADNIDNRVASGSMSVVQKIYFAGGDVMGTGLTTPSLPFSFLIPSVLSASTTTQTSTSSSSTSSSSTPLDVLIAQGERLFVDETFSGNGRTCATCHPPTNNFTIDKNYIASLPPDDPLFVAETNPALAQLERPTLMHEYGLILENVDGMEDPTHKFVMRGVPHTLGLQATIAADTSLPSPPAAMLGWSGDGAAGTGSLREFAIGAIVQHAPKTLARVEGVDFILPNNQQLDAMEAFQLSLGRSSDYDLTKLTFLDAGVASGQDIFVNGTGNPNAGGRCSDCHENAGALASNGENRNFNTNVEDLTHPARQVEDFPLDGGFGRTLNAEGTYGDHTFNTASVVEAADTPPFFHNNVVDTLEGVVEFYSGPQFNTPRPPSKQFSFTPDQTKNLANFMRAINTVQNIQSATRYLSEILALTGNPQPQIQSRLLLAKSDSGDAIRVLTEGNIFNDALTSLNTAQQLIAQAQQTANPNTQATLIGQAITALGDGQNLIVSISP